MSKQKTKAKTSIPLSDNTSKGFIPTRNSVGTSVKSDLKVSIAKQGSSIKRSFRNRSVELPSKSTETFKTKNAENKESTFSVGSRAQNKFKTIQNEEKYPYIISIASDNKATLIKIENKLSMVDKCTCMATGSYNAKNCTCCKGKKSAPKIVIQACCSKQAREERSCCVCKRDNRRAPIKKFKSFDY